MAERRRTGWTVLDLDSFNALRNEPSANNQAIRLEPTLTTTVLSGSAITRNALVCFRGAEGFFGFKRAREGGREPGQFGRSAAATDQLH